MENARKSLYLIVMTLSEVHIQRVHFEPEAPVLIDLVMLMRVTNIETCNAKRVYSQRRYSHSKFCERASVVSLHDNFNIIFFRICSFEKFISSKFVPPIPLPSVRPCHVIYPNLIILCLNMFIYSISDKGFIDVFRSSFK